MNANIIMAAHTTLHWLHHLSSCHFHEVGARIVPILKMKKLNLNRTKVGPRMKALSCKPVPFH